MGHRVRQGRGTCARAEWLVAVLTRQKEQTCAQVAEVPRNLGAIRGLLVSVPGVLTGSHCYPSRPPQLHHGGAAGLTLIQH